MLVTDQGKLTPRRLDLLIEAAGLFEGKQPEIDLRSYLFVTPAAIAQLAAVCFCMAEDGRKPAIIFSNSGIHSYLERAGFLTLIQDHANHNGYIPSYYRAAIAQRRGSLNSLIEIERLDSVAPLSGVIDRMIEVLTSTLRFPERSAWRVGQVISEAGQNPFEHNTATHGFVVMQQYQTSLGPFLEIGVSDCGAGIVQTLARNRENPVFASDADAIRHAMQPDATGTVGEFGRGNGLNELVRVTRTLTGSLRIRSGSAAISLRHGAETWSTEIVGTMPGAHLRITLPEAVLHHNP